MVPFLILRKFYLNISSTRQLSLILSHFYLNFTFIFISVVWRIDRRQSLWHWKLYNFQEIICLRILPHLKCWNVEMFCFSSWTIFKFQLNYFYINDFNGTDPQLNTGCKNFWAKVKRIVQSFQKGPKRWFHQFGVSSANKKSKNKIPKIHICTLHIYDMQIENRQFVECVESLPLNYCNIAEQEVKNSPPLIQREISDDLVHCSPNFRDNSCWGYFCTVSSTGRQYYG